MGVDLAQRALQRCGPHRWIGLGERLGERGQRGEQVLRAGRGIIAAKGIGAFDAAGNQRIADFDRRRGAGARPCHDAGGIESIGGAVGRGTAEQALAIAAAGIGKAGELVSDFIDFGGEDGAVLGRQRAVAALQRQLAAAQDKVGNAFECDVGGGQPAVAVHARVSSAIDVEDLVQIGMISLIEAARAFEDRGHAAFATYATVRIRGAMIDQLRKGATLVRSALRRRREWGAVRSGLEGLLGRRATDGEIAEKLEITVEAYRSAMAATQATHTESIDDVYSDHSDWFADDTPDAHDQLESKSMHKAISAVVGTLPQREAMVLQLYFVEELNLEEIGQVLGVGAARVCQIKKAALGKLRGKLTGWDAA